MTDSDNYHPKVIHVSTRKAGTYLVFESLECSVPRFLLFNDNGKERYEYDAYGDVTIFDSKVNKLDETVAFTHDGEKYFYHKNRLGSIVAISNESGKVVERYDYDAYGDISIYDESGKKLKTSKLGNAITYTGQRLDSETGLYYYKNRYYSPKLGRFLTKDPLGMIDGPNLYAYAIDDPINYIDPMGTTILPSTGDSSLDVLYCPQLLPLSVIWPMLAPGYVVR
jgi:RHS repeat-associated protein